MQKRTGRRMLFTLAPAHFFNDFNNGLLSPLLPILTQTFLLTYLLGGLLVSLTNLLPAVLNPVMGHIADRSGRGKTVLIVGLLVLGVGTTLLSLSGSYLAMVGSVLVIGLGLSTYHPQAMSSLSEEFGRRKGTALGLHGTAGTIGFAAAPLLIIFSHQTVGWRMPLQFSLIPAILLSLILWRVLHLPRSSLETRPKNVSGARRGHLILLGLTAFLSIFASLGVKTFLPMYYVSLGESVEISNLILFLSLVASVIAAPVGGKLSDTRGRRTVIVGFLLVSSPFILIFAFVTGIASILVIILFSFLSGIVFPAFFAYVSDLSGSRGHAVGVGFVFGAVMLAAALAPAIMGAVIDIAGFQPALIIMALVSFSSVIPVLALPRHPIKPD